MSLTWLVGDSTVPKGWKVAQNQNGLRLNRVCSPDGVEFLNRRLALKQLIKNGGLEDTVEEMQGFLVVEGWMKDNHLPKHWRLKVKIFKSQSRNLILSPEGSVFDGVSAAVRCMKTTGNYSIREMEEVKELLKDAKKERKTKKSLAKKIETKVKQTLANKEGSKAKKEQLSNQVNIVVLNWLEDPTVPNGWKTGSDQNKAGRLVLLSPDGTKFVSRRRALTFMIGKGFPEDEIERMRNCLGHEGWQLHPDLPPTWRVKKNRGNSTHALIPSGKTFKSILKAFKYLKNTGECDSDTIDAMKSRISKKPNKTKLVQKDGCNIIKSGTSIKQTRTNRVQTDGSLEKKVGKKQASADDEHIWILDNPTVPEGWETAADPKKPGSQVIQSPSGLQFSSRGLALRHLVQSGCSREEVEGMRLCLGREGWKQHPDLPADWRVRTKTMSSGNIGRQIMTPRGRAFPSLKLAVEYMRKFGECNVTKLERLKRQMVSKPVGSKRWYGWKEHPKVPPGWNMKVKMSPSFKLFLQVDKKKIDLITAVKFMENSKDYTIQDVESLLEIESEIKAAISLPCDSDVEGENKFEGIKIKEEIIDNSYGDNASEKDSCMEEDIKFEDIEGETKEKDEVLAEISDVCVTQDMEEDIKEEEDDIVLQIVVNVPDDDYELMKNEIKDEVKTESSVFEASTKRMNILEKEFIEDFDEQFEDYDFGDSKSMLGPSIFDNIDDLDTFDNLLIGSNC